MEMIVSNVPAARWPTWALVVGCVAMEPSRPGQGRSNCFPATIVRQGSSSLGLKRVPTSCRQDKQRLSHCSSFSSLVSFPSRGPVTSCVPRPASAWPSRVSGEPRHSRTGGRICFTTHVRRLQLRNNAQRSTRAIRYLKELLSSAISEFPSSIEVDANNDQLTFLK